MLLWKILILINLYSSQSAEEKLKFHWRTKTASLSLSKLDSIKSKMISWSLSHSSTKKCMLIFINRIKTQFTTFPVHPSHPSSLFFKRMRVRETERNSLSVDVLLPLLEQQRVKNSVLGFWKFILSQIFERGGCKI